jgi:hypothetical protein
MTISEPTVCHAMLFSRVVAQMLERLIKINLLDHLSFYCHISFSPLEDVRGFQANQKNHLL